MTKRALDVADHIEAAAAKRNWAPGAMLGDESALMARFGVGRSVFRQAIRLCEHLGIATMKRGPKGGLAISEPRPEPASLSLQIAWSKQRLQLRSIERLCDDVNRWAVDDAPEGAHIITKVVQIAYQGFAADGPVEVGNGPSAKLGEQIAQNILNHLIDAAWETPELLGSESHLMSTYGAGRASLREAVHLLELHGVAVMQRGPGGGLLVLRAPSPGAIPRSLRAQLRSSGLSSGQLSELLASLVGSLPAGNLQDAALVLRSAAEELVRQLDVGDQGQ